MQDLDAIIEGHKQWHRDGGGRDIPARVSFLEKIERWMAEHEDRILKALATDLGKPDLEAYLAEIYFLKTELRLFQKKLRSWARPKRVRSPIYHLPEACHIRREAYGAVLIFAPWNYPFQLALSPAIAALGAGNAVVLKPSDMAPATADLLAKLAKDLNEPERFTVVVGDSWVARMLLTQPFDFMFFTGSEGIGRQVADAAARQLCPSVLELGGKCPVVVDDSVDIELVAERLVASKFFNAGQTCLAPDFVAVAEEQRVALVEAMRKRMEKLYGGETLYEDIARIVNTRHYKRLQALLTDSGPVVQIGEDDPDALLMAPRLLADANWEDEAMQDEIFGPILPIVGYSSDQELIDQLRTLSEPLAFYVFSKFHDFVEMMYEAVPSGSFGINDCLKSGLNLNMPFGGVGRSGHGRYRGRHGYETFSYERAVSRRFWAFDVFTLCPPYAGKLKANRRFLK